MKLSHLLIINAIVALVYGIGELLAPATMFSLYGITDSPGARLMAQFFGLTLISVGLLVWFARNVADSEARRAIILALLISDTIGVIVSVIGTVSGVMSAFGWSAVGVYLLLTLGFAYFQFMKPDAS
ncbi:MAG: hypothetical protein JRE40_05515 [Deltaproteobacteria bacterium]|nr:hypothetical protein [Deltaproteobacteria bacterium]